MKKNNNKVSRSKIKRSLKNKKRLADKTQLSKFERKQEEIRHQLLSQFFISKAVNETAKELEINSNRESQ